MDLEYHYELRQSYRWGTYGKSGREPLKWVILRDIHDDHLENILIMVREHTMFFGPNILEVMESEQEYRRIKKIRVPFKFGH